MWNDISTLGKALRAPSVMAVTVRMVDGISLLAPRLATVQKTGAASLPGFLSALDILSDLRVGLNMTRLLRIDPKLERQNFTIRPLLERLSDYYGHRKNLPVDNAAELLGQIDQALYRAANIHSHAQQSNAIAALAGIRRDLFPDALPYSPLTEGSKDRFYGKAA